MSPISAPLHLSPDLRRQIESHLASAYPNEGCGVLLGSDGPQGRRVVSVQPLSNSGEAGTRHHRFVVDGKDLLAAEKLAAARRLSVIGFFHSHPDAPAVPSEVDLASAWEYYSYLITSVRNAVPAETTSWVLDAVAGKFIPQNIHISNGE